MISAIAPLFSNQVSAQDSNDSSEIQVLNTGQWWQINTSKITVLCPVQGQKPMFLWYYNDNSSQVYSVKYRGLVEYLPLNGYYTPNCEANPQTMQSLMLSEYGMGGMHMNQIRGTIDGAYQGWETDFHSSYLPFSACTWHLTDPFEGSDENGNGYVSFNLTLNDAPTGFEFAQNNVEFNCWLYENQTSRNPYGLGSYTIGDGELEMEFSVNNWSWNSNHMSGFFGSMHHNYGVNVAAQTDNLALWCDFATLDMQDINVALNDANQPLTSVPTNSSLAPIGLLEGSSTMTDIIAGGHQIHMQNMLQGTTSPLSVPTSALENYRMQFAEGDKTLPGYFNFANNAFVYDSTTQTAYSEDTTAAYRTGDNYMQLFICYPYFGENTLSHDPSVGIDTNAQLVPENLPIILIITAVTISALAVAVLSRKKIAH